MESRTEQQLQLRLLGRARAALAPERADERPGEHLHYDRNAHAWRTHEELGRPQALVGADKDAALVGCA
jgi:hypothetical protein